MEDAEEEDLKRTLIELGAQLVRLGVDEGMRYLKRQLSDRREEKILTPDETKDDLTDE